MSGFIRKAPVGSAVSELDFYGQPAVDTPHLAYRELLDAGLVVWLPRHKMLAVARFAPLRAMLKADKKFVSSQGVTRNPIFNWGAKKSDTVLVSNGERHNRLRRVLMPPR
jgi:cytochrome P450